MLRLLSSMVRNVMSVSASRAFGSCGAMPRYFISDNFLSRSGCCWMIFLVFIPHTHLMSRWPAVLSGEEECSWFFSSCAHPHFSPGVPLTFPKSWYLVFTKYLQNDGQALLSVPHPWTDPRLHLVDNCKRSKFNLQCFLDESKISIIYTVQVWAGRKFNKECLAFSVLHI